jgi:O-antigen/teichoic acid export membrane protein
LDRFVIGAVASLAAVAFYTGPYEIVTRLWLLPAALSGVLFPAFAASHAADPVRARRLYAKGLLAILASVLPVALLGAFFAGAWLAAWLGPQYAVQGARVAQVLCAGIVVNSLAYVPFTLLQASGRADLAAKAHLVELPFYVAVLALLVQSHGIEGAAWAWTLRCVLDAVILAVLAQRQMRAARPNPGP